MNHWRTTFLAIRLAIWPQKNDVARISPHDIARVTEPVLLLSNLTATIDPAGRLSLTLPGCHPLAAPFILFRLKREGYSDARVVHENGGLTIRARR